METLVKELAFNNLPPLSENTGSHSLAGVQEE